MKQCCFFLVSFLILIFGSSLQSRAADQDSPAVICPQADKYRLQRSFYFSNLKEVVKAPQSPQEVNARFAELSSKEQWRRQAAIAALALGGNGDLFQRLLIEGDVAGMKTYAENYLRKDGNLCLDPQIEEAIVRHFDDSRFTRAFLAFFQKNLYSSPDIFETLAPLQFESIDPDLYGNIIKALCATRLAGFDERLLEIGSQALLHDTPVQKRVMPGVHQSIISYLASQKSPVFSYYRMVLSAEHRGERVAYFQNNYARTRLEIYKALLQYNVDEAISIYLEELNELSQEAWGPFYVNDLNNLLSNLQGHSRFRSNKDEVIPLLRQILSTPSLPQMAGYTAPWERAGDPALYDQQVRKRVYEFLVEIGTEQAATLLVDEFAQLLRRASDDEKRVLITTLLQSLASLPEGSLTEQRHFVALADTLADQVTIVMAAEALGRHPQSAGFNFVIKQFENSFQQAAITKESSARNRLADIYFNILLQFSDPALLIKTRDKIDALFLAENIEQERYQKMSIALAELLGQDSPTFTALLQAKKKEKEEKRRLELIEAQKKWQQEILGKYQHYATPEGIDENIKALSQFGGQAKEAAYWLIRIGKPILAQAHEALEDPEATTELKMQLMIVLGEIGDVASVPFIIKSAKTEPDNAMLCKDAFLSLTRIAQSAEGNIFAIEILEDEATSSRHKMSALAYFASHRDIQGLRWSKKFSDKDVFPPLRASALYMTAMVGNEGVAKQIAQMLKEKHKPGVEHVLWRGLAEVSNYEEYQKTAEKLNLAENWETKQIDQYVRYRTSTGQEKIELARKLLTAKSPLYAESAIDFLLENKRFDLLSTYFQSNGPYKVSLEGVLFASSVAQRIFNVARRQGYIIEEKQGEIVFLPDQKV